ncbi:cytochrome c oxidase subunit 3 [Massilia endophytica]|uniref:cytochrome c oxidase subunit 3 n=1 Tax=Massilia endophytica TaxID=2899220 RepID=UPI001E2DAAA0|nr:cytochrome c oxidase subunit 3 [Massilia endophytica]UGQ44637.1 cytochrome c oxidase subunit 3 [Massilia endophytica]
MNLPRPGAFGASYFHPGSGQWPIQPAPRSAAQVGLWCFMGVMCALFMLCGLAYLMRIAYEDWRVLPPPPWQLWLSTGLLALSSLAWQLAARRARRGELRKAEGLVRLAWLLGLFFVGSQLSAWQAMSASGHSVASGPASSFFYLLTGLHGLHMAGGLAAAAWLTLRRPREAHDAAAIGLCAQYWHLLLLLWLALFGLLFALPPEMVRELCSAIGITGISAR